LRNCFFSIFIHLPPLIFHSLPSVPCLLIFLFLKFFISSLLPLHKSHL
jgi:hypothetical protein